MSGASRTYVPIVDASMGGRSTGSPTTRYDEPQHWLTISHTNPPHPDHFVDAQTAMKNMVQRLKDRGINFEHDGNTITYTDSNGIATTLTYTEEQL